MPENVGTVTTILHIVLLRQKAINKTRLTSNEHSCSSRNFEQKTLDFVSTTKLDVFNENLPSYLYIVYFRPPLYHSVCLTTLCVTETKKKTKTKTKNFLPLRCCLIARTWSVFRRRLMTSHTVRAFSLKAVLKTANSLTYSGALFCIFKNNFKHF